MSLLSNPYPTPSRVRGVFRYLLHSPDHQESRSTLEALMSPPSLRGKGGMIQDTIDESIKLGLLTEMGESVAINQYLSKESKSPNIGDSLLPSTISELIFNSENKANYDLAQAITWYLAQDVYEAPGNWSEVQDRLSSQLGGERFGLNNTRYTQFEDWICYLGFAWSHKIKDSQKGTLVPDPTAYLRMHLGQLLRTNRREPLGKFLQNLAKLCPAFEFGSLRDKLEESFGSREPRHLSTVTAFSLLRLNDEGYLKLSMEADAEAYVLPDGTASRRFSHIIWPRKHRKEGQE
jgi:hypothetical protein